MKLSRCLRRTSSSLAALAVFFVAAANANATSSETITASTGTTKTGSSTVWNSKSVGGGNLGSGRSISSELFCDNTGASKYVLDEASTDYQLFGHTFTLAKTQVKAYTSSATATAAKGKYYVEAFGSPVLSYDIADWGSSWGSLSVDLLSVEGKVGSVDIGASASLTYSSSALEVCLAAEASAEFWEYGYPITIALEAAACSGIKVNKATASTKTVSSKTVPTMDFKVSPYLSTTLTASAGIGTNDVSVGAYCTVDLLKYSTPVTASLSFTPATTTSGTLSFADYATETYSSLSGEFGFYAKFFFFKYTHVLGDWSGFSWSGQTIFSESKPVASGVTVVVSGSTAASSHSYSDSNKQAENKDTTTYEWFRASDSAGTGSTSLGSRSGTNGGSSHTLVEDDNTRYLQVCVTPSNSSSGTSLGDAVCSEWTAVGHVATFYQNDSYGGAALTIAYEQSTSGTCFKLSDYNANFDNYTSSYKAHGPSASSSNIWLYKGTSCSDTASSERAHRALASGSSDLVSAMSTVGGTWNDRLSSFRMVFDEQVSASEVTVAIAGNTATPSYTFSVADTDSTTESGSTYVWYRASSPSATTSSATIVGTGSTRTIDDDDDQQYLKFCVTPSNGYTTGGQACSDWTGVGRLIKLYKDDGYASTNVNLAYQKSTKESCFNLSDYSFNDATSSYKWSSNSGGAATVWLYKDSNCSGTVATDTIAASSSRTVTSFRSTFGTSWNDAVSSIKVSWSTTTSASNVAVTIAGNKATQSHSYYDSEGLAELGSTYTWYRASSALGQSRTTLATTTSSYTLDDSDDQKYLMVCVTPSNGSNLGAASCSDWTAVGNLVNLFSDTAYGGSSLSIAYDKGTTVCTDNADGLGHTSCELVGGTCYNLSDYGFDNVTSSFSFTGTNQQILLSAEKDCVGEGLYLTSSASSISSMNDRVSSFRFFSIQ